MDILLIGSGGREHAIALTLKKSPKVGTVYCAPGNGGTAQIGENVPFSGGEPDKVLAFLHAHPSVGLTVVAPDNPLVDGLVNVLEGAGFPCFGPTKEAAIIEGSKIFAKELMQKYNIPTAQYARFDGYDEAKTYLLTAKYPLVIKADGLAFGKGVIICSQPDEAMQAIADIMQDGVFGKHNTRIIVEEFLTGPEVSLLAFTDGKSVVCMPPAQDHKRALDGDKGLNTGGMGAFAPTPYFTEAHNKLVQERIVMPTIAAMNQEGRTFKGVLYFGLMLCEDEPKVIEYNCRFGDPETQVVLPLLQSDLLEIMLAVREERLDKAEVVFANDTAVTVVVASGGYPGAFTKGLPIQLGDVAQKGVTVFHAGTAQKDGALVTSGGRVFAVTAKGKSIKEARQTVYAALPSIQFEGAFFRRDIGIKE